MAIELNIQMITKACFMTPGLHRRTSKGEKAIDQAALSERMGVNPATVYKLLSGRIQPGERSIPGLLRAFPDLEFNDLFTVTGSDAA